MYIQINIMSCIYSPSSRLTVSLVFVGARVLVLVFGHSSWVGTASTIVLGSGYAVSITAALDVASFSVVFLR